MDINGGTLVDCHMQRLLPISLALRDEGRAADALLLDTLTLEKEG